MKLDKKLLKRKHLMTALRLFITSEDAELSWKLNIMFQYIKIFRELSLGPIIQLLTIFLGFFLTFMTFGSQKPVYDMTV